jgi:argininosuccinate lyase
MSQPCVIFIESNTTGTGRLFARAARSLGYSPLILAEDPSRYPYIAEDGVGALAAQTRDIAELRAATERIGASNIAGVWSSSEYFAAAAAKLAGELGLPGANAEAIENCRSKFNQRVRLGRVGLRTPAFRRATTIDEAVEAARDIGFPVVIKPARGTGSVGVRLCLNRDEARNHTTALLGCAANERGIPAAPEALVEEYLDGPEFSVETFGKLVVGVTAKHVSPLPYFVETGHDFPAPLSRETHRRITQAALAALEAMDLTWGPAHIELRVTRHGPVVVEINPRLVGGFIPELVRRASGIDLIAATVSLATGSPPDLDPSRDACASIRFVISPGCGIIAAIDGVEQAKRIPGVADVLLYRKPGEVIGVEHDFRDRIGHVIATCESQKMAARSAEEGRRRIVAHLASTADALLACGGDRSEAIPAG